MLHNTNRNICCFPSRLCGLSTHVCDPGEVVILQLPADLLIRPVCSAVCISKQALWRGTKACCFPRKDRIPLPVILPGRHFPMYMYAFGVGPLQPWFFAYKFPPIDVVPSLCLPTCSFTSSLDCWSCSPTLVIPSLNSRYWIGQPVGKMFFSAYVDSISAKPSSVLVEHLMVI